VQSGASLVEPILRPAEIRTDALDLAPEGAAVVHLDEMRRLVRGEIFEHERRRENEPP
jgi:hypothetical protein